MKHKIKAGTASFIMDVRLSDSTSTTGAGLNVAYNAAGLTVKWKRKGDSAFTTMSLVTATAGTWTSSGFCQATNAPTGHHELHLTNAMIAAAAVGVVGEIYGATNLVPCPFEIELDQVDYQDAVRFGMTALPNAVFGRVGGLEGSIIADSTSSSSGFYAATSTQYSFTVLSMPVGALISGAMAGDLFVITGGTGFGQSPRVITGNTNTLGVCILTFASAWTTTPDVTTTWEIRQSRLPKLDSSLRVTPTTAGSGASVVTITVNNGTDPIEGATVSLSSNDVLNGSGVTNASGVVALTPDSGDITYTVAIARAQHSFTPTTLAVSGATAHTYSMSALTITPAADPDQTTGFLTTRDGHGTAKASVTIGFRLIKGPGDAGNSYDTAQFTATSNGSGLLTVTLLRDATYVGIRGDGREFEFVTGTTSTHELPENLGVDDA